MWLNRSPSQRSVVRPTHVTVRFKSYHAPSQGLHDTERRRGENVGSNPTAGVPTMVKTAEVDVSLEEQTDESGNGRIKAWVTNQNNQPIGGATVEILSDGGYSDSGEVGDTMGVAQFDDVPIDDYAVTITADGYQTVEATISEDDF